MYMYIHVLISYIQLITSGTMYICTCNYGICTCSNIKWYMYMYMYTISTRHVLINIGVAHIYLINPVF